MIDAIILMFGLGTMEIALIIFVFLLLFGGKKIPELMKGIGKGLRGFKDEMGGKGEESQDKPTDKTTAGK
jgi:sec-independent protein translocase protein TatA